MCRKTSFSENFKINSLFYIATHGEEIKRSLEKQNHDLVPETSNWLIERHDLKQICRLTFTPHFYNKDEDSRALELSNSNRFKAFVAIEYEFLHNDNTDLILSDLPFPDHTIVTYQAKIFDTEGIFPITNVLDFGTLITQEYGGLLGRVRPTPITIPKIKWIDPNYNETLTTNDLVPIPMMKRLPIYVYTICKPGKKYLEFNKDDFKSPNRFIHATDDLLLIYNKRLVGHNKQVIKVPCDKEFRADSLQKLADIELQPTKRTSINA